MWENDTVVLLTSLKKRILGDKKRVNYTVIHKDAAVPEFIKKVLSDHIEQLLIQETPLSVKATPHFDLKKSDFIEIRKKTDEILFSSAFLTKEEVESIIQEALVIRLDYLVKPIETIRRIIFHNEMNLSVERLPEILLPFQKIYNYPDSLIESCKKEKLEEIDSDIYTRITREIMNKDETPEAITDLLKDFSILIEYLSETKGEEINMIEGEVVQDFLADRYMHGFKRALDIELKLGRNDFSASDLELILRRYLELRIEFSGKVEAVEGKQNIVSLKDHEITVPVEDSSLDIGDVWEQDNEQLQPEVEVKPQPDPEPEGKEESFDFSDSFKADPVEELVANEAIEEDLTGAADLMEEAGILEETATEDSEEKPMRIIRREKDEPEADKNDKKQEEEKELQGLQSLVEEKTEKLFIKKLFNGDREAYTALFDKLNEAESWRVAKILIDNELFKRDVDPFSREAIKLVDLVYSRYYPEEAVGG